MTQRYAVIGNPIAQSRSPQVHALFAAACGVELAYDRLLAPTDGFADTVAAFRASGGKGLNVTAPFKQEAAALATRLSDAARRAGAVNTLRFAGDAIEGENFDGAGLVRDITINLRQSLAGQRILLLGAGGAARGCLAPLLAQRPASITIANRTAHTAQALADDFADIGAISGAALADLAGEGLPGATFDIIINATSAGLLGDALPLAEGNFRQCALAYELSYGKQDAPFLVQAGRGGAAKCADGSGMLVEQAAEAFFWWHGIRPDTAQALSSV